jgi:hypothetical protein
MSADFFRRGVSCSWPLPVLRLPTLTHSAGHHDRAGIFTAAAREEATPEDNGIANIGSSSAATRARHRPGGSRDVNAAPHREAHGQADRHVVLTRVTPIIVSGDGLPRRAGLHRPPPAARCSSRRISDAVGRHSRAFRSAAWSADSVDGAEIDLGDRALRFGAWRGARPPTSRC